MGNCPTSYKIAWFLFYNSHRNPLIVVLIITEREGSEGEKEGKLYTFLVNL